MNFAAGRAEPTPNPSLEPRRNGAARWPRCAGAKEMSGTFLRPKKELKGS